jgi:hypothetical protein
VACFTAIAVALALGTTACGGEDDAPNGSSAAACLRELGLYTTQTIDPPVRVLGVAVFGYTDVPTGLSGISDVSFRSPGGGANAATIFFSESDAGARTFRQTLVRSMRSPLLPPRRPEIDRLGTTNILWSSTPTKNQRVRLRECVVP